jgi:hypothetical protein
MLVGFQDKRCLESLPKCLKTVESAENGMSLKNDG